MSPLERLLHWRKIKIEEAKAAGEEFFMDFPDKWYDPVHWACESGHVSSRYLKSEKRGNICLACHRTIYLFPEMTEEELRAIIFPIPGECHKCR